MKGLLRTKETKTHIYKCQKNQGHGRSCRQPTSLDGSASLESGLRAGVWRRTSERRLARGGALITA